MRTGSPASCGFQPLGCRSAWIHRFGWVRRPSLLVPSVTHRQRHPLARRFVDRQVVARPLGPRPCHHGLQWTNHIPVILTSLPSRAPVVLAFADRAHEDRAQVRRVRCRSRLCGKRAEEVLRIGTARRQVVTSHRATIPTLTAEEPYNPDERMLTHLVALQLNTPPA